MPICLPACVNLAATDWFFVELDIGDLMKICQETPNFVKKSDMYQAHHIKT